MNRLIFISLLLLAAAGCTSQPARISHYNLPGYNEPASLETEVQTDATPVRVDLQVAGYLSAPGIVYQTSELEVESAYGHRWAEALPVQLNRILLTALVRSEKHFRSVSKQPDNAGKGYEVLVDVERFQGRYDGKAIVIGSWTLKTLNGQFIKVRRFNIETPLDEDGYPQLVRSLNRGWKQVCGEIVAELEQLSAK